MQAFSSILSGDYVVITDFISESFLCSLPNAQLDNFFISPPIFSATEAYIFPKKRNAYLERVYNSFEWVNALGLYKHYLKAMTKMGKHYWS